MQKKEIFSLNHYVKEFIANRFDNQKVLILGFGREGKSTFRLLSETKTYASLAIADQNPVTLESSPEVELITGNAYLDCLDRFDVVIKSPGIVLPNPFSYYRCKITSQTELFLQCCHAQTVGITGTKGKSTTSSLLYHILHKNGIPSVLAGNIGIPVFDIAQTLTKETVVVLELSCHQLEHIQVAPEISVFLNLYEDHLDYYGSFERYAYAKQNIYRRQKEGDLLFCHPDFLPATSDCVSRVTAVSVEHLPPQIAERTRLKGAHNLWNLAVCYEICKQFSLSEEQIASAVATFEPLRHRLEFIGTKNGVDYYDDSISTTAESAISAVNSIPNAATLLIGGMDRGIEYGALISYLLTCPLKRVICMYESGKRIYDLVLKKLPDYPSAPEFVWAEDLKAAVKDAKQNTNAGGACILSPAAASYGYFKNFEERGDVFRSLALEA